MINSSSRSSSSPSTPFATDPSVLPLIQQFCEDSAVLAATLESHISETSKLRNEIRDLIDCIKERESSSRTKSRSSKTRSSRSKHRSSKARSTTTGTATQPAYESLSTTSPSVPVTPSIPTVVVPVPPVQNIVSPPVPLIPAIVQPNFIQHSSTVIVQVPADEPLLDDSTSTPGTSFVEPTTSIEDIHLINCNIVDRPSVDVLSPVIEPISGPLAPVATVSDFDATISSFIAQLDSVDDAPPVQQYQFSDFVKDEVSSFSQHYDTITNVVQVPYDFAVSDYDDVSSLIGQSGPPQEFQLPIDEAHSIRMDSFSNTTCNYILWLSTAIKMGLHDTILQMYHFLLFDDINLQNKSPTAMAFVLMSRWFCNLLLCSLFEIGFTVCNV